MSVLAIRRNYYWRLLASGFCFFMFGAGVLAACLLLLPLEVLPGPEERKQRLARRLIRTLFGWFVRLVRASGTALLHLEGEARLQRPGSKVIVANHPTLIDVVVLLSVVPDAICVVKAEFERYPIIRYVLRRTGYVTNSSAEELLGGCTRAFQQGCSVLLFPEGTRSVPGKPLKLLRGAAQIALRCRQDLVPVLITCRPPALLKGQKWYDIPRHEPFQMYFQVAPDIPVHRFLDANEGISLTSRKLTRHLTDYFHRRLALPVEH